MTKPKVDLVIADTDAYVLANNAITACLSRFDFSSVIVFTDQVELWPQYKTIRIPKISSIEDYNRLMVSDLAEVLQGDFCVVAQYDGFIVNPAAFSECFYQQDYIGATWPDYPYFKVGNGGFSWRSRRLVEGISELALLRQVGEPEDLFICRLMRVILETRYGCQFADEDLARRFSYEIMAGESQPFGFHGVFNLPLIYRESLEYLVEHLPERVVHEKMGLLSFGARFLSEEQRHYFHQLCARRLAGGEALVSP